MMVQLNSTQLNSAWAANSTPSDHSGTPFHRRAADRPVHRTAQPSLRLRPRTRCALYQRKRHPEIRQGVLVQWLHRSSPDVASVFQVPLQSSRSSMLRCTRRQNRAQTCRRRVDTRQLVARTLSSCCLTSEGIVGPYARRAVRRAFSAGQGARLRRRRRRARRAHARPCL